MASYYSHEIEDGEEEPELRISPVIPPLEEEAETAAEGVAAAESDSDEEEDDEEDFWYLRWRDDRLRLKRKEIEEDEDEETDEAAAAEPWPRRSGGGGGVMLEGYVDGDDQRSSGSVARTKSLTDDDLDELKGCLDLGFGFNYEEIPELCNTLPALELCYSMSQKFLDEQQQRSPDRSSASSSGEVCEHSQSPASAPIANWKISSPGDDPDEVKARLKYWAQAVACTVRLCS